METTQFVPLDALATTLGLPRQWLKTEADAGRIPFLKAGRRRVFDPDAVARVLSDRASARTSEGVHDGQ